MKQLNMLVDDLPVFFRDGLVVQHRLSILLFLWNYVRLEFNSGHGKLTWYHTQ